LALAKRTQPLHQLTRAFGELVLASADKVELPFDHRNCRLDDPRAFFVVCALGPLIARSGRPPRVSIVD
jgi:hypothetical protein